MSSEIGELKIGLVFEDKSFNSSIKNLEATSDKAAQTTSLKWQAMAGIVQNVAVGAFNAATSAVTGFASSIVSTGMQFDTAMSQVAATMGVTVDDIEELSAVAQQMGATTKFTATEAAEGLNILAMAGLSAQEQIAGISTVLDLASAGAMSLENSASYIVGAVNGFSDSMDNAQYYADLMAKGATLANTSVNGLGAALGRSAATAATYGQAADGVTLSLLRLATQNVTGEEAATALNRAMADLYTPTKDAAAALEELGISAYDANGSARDFNEVADELKIALSGMSDEEANAYASTIFTAQGLRAFNMMTTASTEVVDGFRDGLENAFGSAAAQAHTQIDNLEGSMTILSSSFDGAKLSIYNSLRPALLDGANGLLDFAGVLQAVLSGSDPTELIGGFVGKMGQAFTNGFSQVGSIIGKVTPVLVQAVVGILPDMLKGLMSGLANMVTEIAAALPDMLLSIVDSIMGIVYVITSPENIQMMMQAGLDLLMGLVEAIPLVITLLAESIPTIINNIVQTLITGIPMLIEGALQFFHAIIDAIPLVVVSLVNALPQILDTILTYLLAPETIEMLFNSAIELFTAIILAIPEMIMAMIPVLPDILGTIIGYLLDPATLSQLLNAATQLFLQLVLAVPKILGQLVKAFGDLVGKLWENIKVMFGKFADNFGTFITDIFKGAINGMLTFIENFINTPINILNGFIGIINDAFGWLGVNLGKISLVELPRLQYGGIIPGDDYTGDHVLARVNSGEMVLTRGQQGALWNAIESGELGGAAPAMPEPATADVDVWVKALAQAFAETQETTEDEERPLELNQYFEVNSELDAENIGNIIGESIRRAA